MKKEFKTIDEQIEVLKNKGLIIEDETYAKEILLKEKEFVLMSQEKNEFTIIAITGNLTLQEIQGIINKE